MTWDPETRKRLEELADAHKELALRFTRYHLETLKAGDKSEWGVGAAEEEASAKAISAALAEIDRLSAPKAWTSERRADLQSLVAQALERDLEHWAIEALAQSVAERLLLEPKVWDLTALMPPAKDPSVD